MNQTKKKNIDKLRRFNKFCSICNKINSSIEKAIPCNICNNLIHRKCSNLNINYIENKLHQDTYMCQVCMDNTFPLSKLIDIKGESFNSNFKDVTRNNRNDKYNRFKIDEDQILNLKKLTFNENTYHAKFDPDEEIKDNSNFSFYTTKDFHGLKNKIKNRKTFSLMHTNIESLNSNCEKLQYLLNDIDYQFDIIALTETWNDEKNKHLFQAGILDDYYQYEGITGNSLKGGCGFYINKSITYIPRNDLDIRHKDEKNEFEGKWIEIVNMSSNKNMIIGVNYRHPRNSDIQYKKYLKNVFKKIKKENKTLIIAGDFNYNLLKHETKKDVNDFINFMSSNLMQAHILGPSRVRADCKPSLVDNIFLNDLDIECTSGNLYGKISDHMPNFIIMENIEYLQDKKEEITIRDMSKLNEAKFINDINIEELSKLINKTNDINEQYNIFHNHLIQAIDKNAPIKTLTTKEKKSKTKPWITKGIIKSINRKNKMYKKYVKTKNENIYKEYQKLRNKLSHIIRESKKEHYNKYFEDNKQNAKKMWSGINDLTNKKSNKRNNHIHLQIGDKIISKPKEVGNQFNKYFTGIATKMMKTQKESKTDASKYLKNRV